ncbi:hypothetical protein N7466_004139 [Penicillium verhagenii]|uniref:uncharacterized protein n=1 Tax=Penicillium verhagenii TaxID=1562060 RepID=UPI0025455149|nr:uncharacterized protein N7466_004139 [Penicillium verhagenii]KAJ5934592.1 hypothetical protein N7466_004139 [Penicillium verhagenii]
MVALITPFTNDKTKIDEARLQAHIEYLIKAGVHGLVPGGSTSEFTVMITTERIGSISSTEAIKLSKYTGKASATIIPGGVWGVVNFIPKLAVELYKAISI